MQTKHTPGPWKTGAANGHPWNVLANGSPRLIAQCYHSDTLAAADLEIDEATTRANARLIAAAPEMYEVLKSLPTGGLPDWYSKKVLAALAKAEGLEAHADVVGPREIPPIAVED